VVVVSLNKFRERATLRPIPPLPEAGGLVLSFSSSELDKEEEEVLELREGGLKKIAWSSEEDLEVAILLDGDRGLKVWLIAEDRIGGAIKGETSSILLECFLVGCFLHRRGGFKLGSRGSCASTFAETWQDGGVVAK
jgi:hypothetical protein